MTTRLKTILLDVATVLAVVLALAHFLMDTNRAKSIFLPCNVFDTACIVTIPTASGVAFSEESDRVRNLAWSIRNTKVSQKIMKTAAKTPKSNAPMAQGGPQ